jgi:hypothetical protein
MARVDPIGFVILDMRANAPDVVALLPDANRIQGNELRTAAPAVLVGVLGDRPSISAPRSPVRDMVLAFRCYAPKSPTGDIAARALGLAVGEYLHQRGPRVSASGVGIYISIEQNTTEPIPDPITGDPMVLVTVGFKTSSVALSRPI